MPKNASADVVFVVDASASMLPCIDGLRANVRRLLESLERESGQRWDVRFDFVAHRASRQGDGSVLFSLSSVFADDLWRDEYNASAALQVFTTDTALFCQRLERLRCEGDEASLVGLDCALDLPWRDAATTHRIVVLFTDEPVESGAYTAMELAAIPALKQKLVALGVRLFVFAPESSGFSSLAEAKRVSYELLENVGDGLRSVDFSHLLESVGKTVSRALLQGPASTSKRGVFGQETWSTADGTFGGR